MKTYKISFLTKHESYNGYALSDGWSSYIVEARTEKSAMNKAKEQWDKKYHKAYWVSNSSIMIID